jgi:hypothetical protein
LTSSLSITPFLNTNTKSINHHRRKGTPELSRWIFFTAKSCNSLVFLAVITDTKLKNIVNIKNCSPFLDDGYGERREKRGEYRRR